MAKVRRVSLFSREIIERLSPAGMDLLLEHASHLSEGQIAPDGDYYGSTMITLDLRQIDACVRDRCDVATAARLARQMSTDAAVISRVRKLAIEEARRLANAPLLGLEVEMRARAEGRWIFIDVDVEGGAARSASA